MSNSVKVSEQPQEQAEPGSNPGDLLAAIDPNLAGLVGSITAFASGAFLLLDDATDLGEFNTPDHPSPFHHWLWGALLLIGGVAGMGATMLNLLTSNPDMAEKLRDHMQEAHFLRTNVLSTKRDTSTD